MKKPVMFPVVVLLFWAGFVSSISFMEAWLKFHAEGVTLPVGLSIGVLVFGALNLAEWLFLTAVLIYLLIRFHNTGSLPKAGMALVLAILLLQTFWLLPDLNQQARQIITGLPSERSPAHWIFGILEVIKVITLIVLAIRWPLHSRSSSA